MTAKMHAASAPAKVILFGEHFVVYGNPAILAAVNRRVTANAGIEKTGDIIIKSEIAAGRYSTQGFKARVAGAEAKAILDPLHDAIMRVIAANKRKVGVRVDLSSEIPHGIGLGSSAASCVSTVAAVDSIFARHGREWICRKAIESERLVHENSSGADCYVSTFGGLILYNRTQGYKRIEPKRSLSLLIGNAGGTHSTGDLVARVGRFRDRNQSQFRDLALSARAICKAALVAIRSGKLEQVGPLMNENQELLAKIGVSHIKTENLIDAFLRAGALGAKITGAGGDGGVLALAASAQESHVIAARVRAGGWDSFQAEIDSKGLIIHR